MESSHSDYPVFTSCPLNDWLENRNKLSNDNVTKVTESVKREGDKLNSKGKGIEDG